MRYALFYTPRLGSALAEAAHGWIGRNAFDATDVPTDDIGGITADTIKGWSSFPRLYGFHGTLRAPFRLADGRTEQDAVGVLHKVADQFAPFNAGSLQLTTLGSFLALTLDGDGTEMRALADACVRGAQSIRAPLTPQEIERRKPDQLSETERGYLHDWGYPYIFDAFRFHLTLTRALEDADELAHAKQAATAHFAAHMGAPLTVEGIGLFAQPEGKNFYIHTYAPLAGELTAETADLTERQSTHD